jgi:hypothetical protein
LEGFDKNGGSIGLGHNAKQKRLVIVGGTLTGKPFDICHYRGENLLWIVGSLSCE